MKKSTTHKIINNMSTARRPKVAFNEEAESSPIVQSYNVFKSDVGSSVFRVYLSGDIGESIEYSNLCDIFRSAPDNSTILFYINSSGGDLGSTLQILNAMNDSEAEIVTICDGAAHSAAGLLFLGSNQFMLKEHSIMMCHNYIGGGMGKGNEIMNRFDFANKHIHDVMWKYYEGFLNKSEFDQMTAGRDFWFNGNEIKERLDAMIEFRNQREQETIANAQKKLSEIAAAEEIEKTKKATKTKRQRKTIVEEDLAR